VLVSTAKISPTKLEFTILIKNLSFTSIENSAAGRLTLREVREILLAALYSPAGAA